jgi:hypothetical protein
VIWEHQYGVEIGTLDNPGWRLKIDLEGTHLKGKALTTVEIDRSDKDWIHCRINEAVFEGFGGARNLEEMLQIFLEWSAS